MRREDRHRLEQPYPQATPIPERFADALGVGVASVRELEQEVFGDLDESAHGVGWWAPHPGTSRRILISDHLLMCIRSIQTNLVEARLHLLELRDYTEQEDGVIAHAITHDREGRPSVTMPAREKAADDLPLPMSALHIAGFFRAVGSALDCLGAVIVGVLAVPISILKADMGSAQGALAKVKDARTPGQALQTAFAQQLASLIDAAGPPSWLPWATNYRNMLVHRGRRLQLAFLDRRGAVLHGPDGRPIMLARSVSLLDREPALSDVEALFSMAGELPVLTEDAATTLEGVMSSALTLASTATHALVEVWKKRRAEPALLAQPKQQWPEGLSTSSLRFNGYKAGNITIKPDQLRADETVLRRLKVAALDGVGRKKWESFD